jgi:hypothetical protein
MWVTIGMVDWTRGGTACPQNTGNFSLQSTIGVREIFFQNIA